MIAMFDKHNMITLRPVQGSAHLSPLLQQSSSMHCPLRLPSATSHSDEWLSPPSRCRLLVSNAVHPAARAMQGLISTPSPASISAAAASVHQPMRVHLAQQVQRLPAQLHSRSARASIIAAAAAAQPQQEAVVVPIPGSKEEAVSAAVSALLGQVKGLGKKAQAKKGFGASGGGPASTRFSIELPLPSSSPADSAAFVGDVLHRLPAAAVADATVVCASEQTAAAAAAAGVLPAVKGLRVLSLQAACRAESLTGPLLLVEPSVADVALVDQLLDEVWAGPWAVALNPGWFTDGQEVPGQYRALVDSWQAAYSLTITATQGLMRTEGAVLRVLAAGSGGDSSSPWRVLLKDGRSDRFLQVGQMKRRPTSSDLELAFLNAQAAQSPLTSLAKGFKGIFGKKQQQ